MTATRRNGSDTVSGWLKVGKMRHIPSSGEGCQVKHWKSHKAFCKQLKQMHRASSIFQEIFEHFILITNPINRVIEQIAEKKGMIMVEAVGDPVTPPKPPAWSRFPVEIAPSPETGVAAALHSTGNMVFEGAVFLMEMLIRRLVRDQFNPIMTHEAAVVTLPCGLSVVLDPTARQFGWKETVSRHHEFSKQRIHNPVSTDDVELSLPGSRFMNEKNAGTVSRARFGGIKRFLQLKESEVLPARAGVVAAAKRGLSVLAEEMNKLARPIIFRGPSSLGSSANESSTNPEACEVVDIRRTDSEGIETQANWGQASMNRPPRMFPLRFGELGL
ncbi:hypothetical protein N658DRAFT_562874 [Parathielavia hyrcaniae]|uniref:Uncharacterized protein n=1 Tax=Parathielavia hyrcaniae TaxID=113614 RepID=A0AAN6PPX4_9PEZI|nr:hypothetical protein N658DRAFT_562874 [Parathielavia hyrcaniae]